MAPHRSRELALLDEIDAAPRVSFAGEVWRVTREGRDPLAAGRSLSRWCNGDFDVLYTCAERDGALAEIHALLSMQPVFPSKPRWFAHRLHTSLNASLTFANIDALAALGVDTPGYSSRGYKRTQEIADAAFFLGFDGIVAPSARWSCANTMIFTERVTPDRLDLRGTEWQPLDWAAWRGSRGR